MEHYFNFPLSLLQSIRNDIDHEGLLTIIAYGTMSFSEKISFKKEAIAKQMIYLYYRRQYFLPQEVKKSLEEMYEDGRILEEEQYHGFSDTTFNPVIEYELGGILRELESDEIFYKKCIKVYQEHQAVSLLNVNYKIINDLRDKYKEAKEFLRSFEQKYRIDSWTSVSNNLIFEVYKGNIEMSYLRIIAAAKSVIGKRNYNDTYKPVLLSRMFGCKNYDILHEFLSKNPELKSHYEFLTKRRQWEKLINTAMEKKYISYFSTGRKFYVSVRLTENELGNEVRQRKDNNTINRITND